MVENWDVSGWVRVFIEGSERGTCSNGHFVNDDGFLLKRLQVDNCNFELGHWLFDRMVLLVNWDVLRMITASYWIVANFPNQSTSLFHSPLLLELRWHLPPKGRKFPARKGPRFVWCKAIYGSICYMAVTKLPSISTWWSRTHTIYHLVLQTYVGAISFFSQEKSYFLMIRIFLSWWRLMVNGDSGKNHAINFFLVVRILSQIDQGLSGLI